MKKIISEFFRRGVTACGFGPIVLAFLYLILQNQGIVTILNVNQVCLGIFSLSALAFIAGGMNAIYQIEQLPLMAAILIHGCVLYIAYLITYLLNNWLEWGIMPILIFTGIFILGYLLIWAIIFSVTKKNTAQINERLKKKQQVPEENTLSDFANGI